MKPDVRLAGGVLAVWLATVPVPACGPYFPNSFLADENAVLTAPSVRFHAEIERMKLTPPPHRRVTSEKGFTSEAADADIAELRAALDIAGVAPSGQQTTVEAHRVEREKLRALADYNARARDQAERELLRNQPPPSKRIAVVAGLPGEFADYFRGAVAWHTGDEAAAIAAWQALLERPAEERHYRSVWAAFMLGKAHLKREPQKAAGYFQQTRVLARAGFADSIGLGASSLGWEAKAHFTQEHWVPAIELYLKHATTGDETAIESLRLVVAAAFKKDAPLLVTVAAHPRARRVMTAYLLASGGMWSDSNENADLSEKWLAAAESAGVRDVESAEQLALAAYRAYDPQLARRWIQRCAATPTAQWLQAKLLLHDGKVADAAASMEKVARLFPIQPPSTNDSAAVTFSDALYVPSEVGSIQAAREVTGELGVLRLARREYVLALDALLRSSFWTDAAYVAERVLGADELKTYVDRYWPAVPAVRDDDGSEWRRSHVNEMSPARQSESIRWLLARRLARQQRLAEARPYYPPAWQPQCATLAQSLAAANNARLSASQRAAGFWAAACLTRTNGMELVGTEMEPDWALHAGGFEDGPTVATRAGPGARLGASEDELRRAQRKEVSPEKRFHYRYVAASLAMKAASLMPDNSDATADVLCTAGDWLKGRDPKAAEVYYRALVRRCPKTALGAEADRQRWFPERGVDGRPLPKEKRGQSFALP
jgi:hypothetical protein